MSAVPEKPGNRRDHRAAFRRAIGDPKHIQKKGLHQLMGKEMQVRGTGPNKVRPLLPEQTQGLVDPLTKQDLVTIGYRGWWHVGKPDSGYTASE
jgi:hypothetical protein